MTQLKDARKGNVTEAMKKVAEEEGISVKELLGLVAQGTVVVPVNPNHSAIHPVGIGEKLSLTSGCRHSRILMCEGW